MEISEFAKQTNATLTVMRNGEYWFHTEEQMKFLDEWITSLSMERKVSHFEFISQVSALQGMRLLSLKIDSKWFDEGREIPKWCEALDKKWKNQKVL